MTVGTRVRGRFCTVLGSITPPDDRMLSLLILCHTLRKERALDVVALLPYLAYSRQDKDEKRKSLASAWTGALLRASGVRRVVTFDVHSTRAARYVGLPLVSLFPAEAFAKRLAALSLAGDVCLVAPDDGARRRCEAVAKAAGIRRPIVRFHKRRTDAGVAHVSMEGTVVPRAVVVDDILDTGATLVSCCRGLVRAGAREIVVMVTHGLFTGEGWKELWSVGVREIHCTDTVPLPPAVRSSRIRVIPIIASAASALRAPTRSSDNRRSQ
jgi:ribose-phosphate pyrophosphokinase